VKKVFALGFGLCVELQKRRQWRFDVGGAGQCCCGRLGRHTIINWAVESMCAILALTTTTVTAATAVGCVSIERTLLGEEVGEKGYMMLLFVIANNIARLSLIMII